MISFPSYGLAVALLSGPAVAAHEKAVPARNEAVVVRPVENMYSGPSAPAVREDELDDPFWTTLYKGARRWK